MLDTTTEFERIIERLPALRQMAEETKEILLTNLIMIGEIPSPTFEEEERVNFLNNRFTECGLQNCSGDELGNGFGILPGSDGGSSLLIVAHADTIFARSEDHTIHVQPDTVSGAGIGDNSLGLAVLATLPTLLERLGIRLRDDLILMAAARSLGRGDLAGIRFFLENRSRPIRAALSVEGVRLGRLSYKSLGMVRCELTCRVPEEYDWTRFGASNAIANLNQVMNKIDRIPRPRSPRTSIVMGSISGGSSFGAIPTSAKLRFEVRSESAEQVHAIWNEIETIADEVASETGSEVDLNVFARREPGGIPFSHPLVQRTRAIMHELGVEPRQAPSTSELSALIDRGVPALTLGIAEGSRHYEADEKLSIDSMFKGLAQIVGVLLAIDSGLCDER